MAINLRNNVTGTGLNLVTNPILKSSSTNPVNIGVKTPVNQYKTEDPRYANKTQVNTQVQTTAPMSVNPKYQTTTPVQTQTQVQTPVNNNQSRFIGFQAPTLQDSLNILQQRQQTQGNTTKKTTTAKTTKNNNYTYDQLVKAIQDFHYDVKNSDGKLTKQQISKKYPEFKGKEEEALRLQEALLPYVKDNEFAPIEGIQQYFPDLLQIQQQGQEKATGIEGLKQFGAGLKERFEAFGRGIDNLLSKGQSQVDGSGVDLNAYTKYIQEKYGVSYPAKLDKATRDKELEAVKNDPSLLAPYTTKTADDILDVAEGGVDIAFSTFNPVATAAFTTAGGLESMMGGGALTWFGEKMGGIGSIINELPGLKQLRDSLSEENQQRFDMFVANSALGLIMGTKNKQNIIKNPKQFLIENLQPNQISKNFMENVIGISDKAYSGIQRAGKFVKKIGEEKNIVTNGVKNADNVNLKGENIVKNADNTEIKAGEVKQGENKITETNNVTKNGGWSKGKVNESIISKGVDAISEGLGKIKKNIVEPITDAAATKITSTATPQDKLFQAVSPSLNRLTNKRGNYNAKRQNADRSNELIIEYGYQPKNTTEYYADLIKTKQDLWKEIQAGLDEHAKTTVNSKELTDYVREAMSDDAKYPLETNKADLARLTRELDSLDEIGELSLERLEAIKQQINAKLNYGKNAEAGEIYEKGLREMNKKISEMEDQMVSELPGELTKFKKDYGALKDMEEDVLKMMLKDMKRKSGGSLYQNRGRLEALGKITTAPLEATLQFMLGESLGKARDVDFLIEKGFKDLKDMYKGEKKTLQVKKAVTAKKDNVTAKKEEPKKEDMSKKEEKTNMKKEPEQKKEDSARKEEKAEKKEDSMSDFVKEMEESSNIKEGEVSYKDISTRTLNKLYESEKTPKSEKAKIEKELEIREADMNGGAKDYDLLDHEYAYRINQLAEEEKRIGKVGKNDVNKAFKEKQSLELKKKVDRLREEMKEDYKDRFSSDAELDEHYNALRNKGINYINEYKLSKNYSTFKQEDELINSLNERWSKQPKFVRELTEEQQNVRESSIGDYKNDNYEIKTTDYQDSFSSKNNPKNKGAIYWGDNERVVVNRIETLKESGLLDKLPDDMKVEVSGEGEIGTIKDLKNLDSEGVLGGEPKTPRNVIGNGKNNATTRFQKSQGKKDKVTNKNKQTNAKVDEKGVGKQYKQYTIDGKERSDYEKLNSKNKMFDREQTLDGLKYDIILSKERGYDIGDELFIQRKVAEDGIKRIQDSIDTGKGYWVGGDNFVTDKAVLNKLMNEKKKIIDYIDNFDESTLKEYNGLGLSEEKISQQINSKEFKDFIGDSIAKNPDGTPKNLYHGTTDGGFTVFDINRSGRNANKLGPGIYLSNEPKVAREYTKHMNQETGKLYKEDYDTPEIMKVYARLENPLMIDKELIDLDAVKKVLKEGTKEYFFDNEIPFFLNGKIELTKDQIKALPKDKRVDLYVDYLSKGNDIQDVNKELLNQVSRAYRDNLEQGLQNLSKATGKDGVFFEKGGSEQYVLWNNSQVKSATDNIGTFDKNNPDIRFQKIGDKEVEIKPNADSPEQLIEKNADGLSVMKSFISEKQAEKALNVNKALLDKDGNPYLWTHTNKYDAPQFANFENAKDSKYKEFGDYEIAWFSNSEDMSRSYANQESKLADTKPINSIEEFNDRFSKYDIDGTPYNTEWKKGDNKEWKYGHKTSIDKEGNEYVLNQYDSESHKYKDLETLYNEWNNGGYDGQSEKEVIDGIKKMVHEEFIDSPDFRLYDDVDIKKEKDGYVLTTSSKKELGRYKSEQEALAKSTAKKHVSGKYHYQGIITDIKNPLVVDLGKYKPGEIKRFRDGDKIVGEHGRYWSDLGNAYEFVKREQPNVDEIFSKIEKEWGGAKKASTDIKYYAFDIEREGDNLYKAYKDMEEGPAKKFAEERLSNYRKASDVVGYISRGVVDELKPEWRNLRVESNGKTTTIGNLYDKAISEYNKYKDVFDVFGEGNRIWKESGKYSQPEGYDKSKNRNFINLLKKNGMSEGAISILHGTDLMNRIDLTYSPLSQEGWATSILKDKSLQTNDYVFYALRKGGYDGVIFKDIIDYGGKGDNKGGDVLAAFKSKDFKAWDNANPTDSKYIMYEKGQGGKNGEGYIGRSSFTEKSLNKAIENMKKTGLAKDVKTVDTVSDLRKELKGKISKSDLLQVDGEIAGCTTPDGTVYLVKEFLRDDTLKHEFAHRFRSYAEKNNPELFKAINKVAEEAPTELKERIKRDYGELSDDALLDEVFAWKQGEFKVTGAELKWYQKMWKAIEELWNSIKSKFGKNYADLSAFDGWEKMSSEQIMSKINDILENGKKVGKPKNLVTNKRLREQAVWHGSKASFDRFDSSHMGEGEGNQAHGWGHYVAVNEKTSRRYAELGKQENKISYKGQGIEGILNSIKENPENQGIWQLYTELKYKADKGESVNVEEIRDNIIKQYERDSEWAKSVIKEVDDKEKAKKAEGKRLGKSDKEYRDNIRKMLDMGEKKIQKLKEVKADDWGIEKSSNNLYNVEIPDPIKKDTPTGSNYLEEDGNIQYNQIEKIAEGLEKYDERGNWGKNAFLRGLIPDLKDISGGWDDKLNKYVTKGHMSGRKLYNHLVDYFGGRERGEKKASKFLESLGYDGIHYYGGIDGEAYVIFNDDALKINSHTKRQKTKATGNSKNRVTSK